MTWWYRHNDSQGHRQGVDWSTRLNIPWLPQQVVASMLFCKTWSPLYGTPVRSYLLPSIFRKYNTPNGAQKRLTLKSGAVATFNQHNGDLQDLLRCSLQKTLKHSQQGHIRVFLQHQLVVFALSDSVVDPLGTPRLESVVQRVAIPSRITDVYLQPI